MPGVSGNVLINEKTNRLGSYDVWDYAEGQDSYRRSMLVDLTQPAREVTMSDALFKVFLPFLLFFKVLRLLVFKLSYKINTDSPLNRNKVDFYHFVDVCVHGRMNYRRP